MADTKISGASRLTGTGIVKAPVALAGSTTAFSLAHNLEATADPGVGDDDADGYSIGSLWLNKSTGSVFVAKSVGTGAADWRRLGPGLPPVLFWMDTDVHAANPFMSSFTNAAQSADTLYQYPIFLPEPRTITTISIVRGSAVSGNARLGLYNMLKDGKVGTLIVDGGAVDTNGTGVVSATVSQLVPAGWHWAAAVFSAAANVARASANPHFMGTEIGSPFSSYAGVQRAFTYGALPADESAQTYTKSQTPPWIGIR